MCPSDKDVNEASRGDDSASRGAPMDFAVSCHCVLAGGGPGSAEWVSPAHANAQACSTLVTGVPAAQGQEGRTGDGAAKSRTGQQLPRQLSPEAP